MTMPGQKRRNEAEILGIKKQRFCEPDIQVTLQWTDEGDKKMNEVVYDLHGGTMTRLSTFFDTALSVEMKEKETKEITLKDVKPGLFERALQFLLDPVAIRSMKPEDAFYLLMFYDMYGFESGIELCDEILKEDFLKMCTNTYKLIELTVKAYECNLSSCLRIGCQELTRTVFEDYSYPFHAAMLTVDQVEMLQPLFKSELIPLPTELSSDDLDNPYFSKYFAKCMSCEAYARSHNISSLVFKLKGYDVDNVHKEGISFVHGGYRNNSNYWIDANNTDGDDEDSEWFLEKRRFGDNIEWVIWEAVVKHEPQSVVFRCPDSGSMDFPPSGPWEPIHDDFEGTSPVLRYVSG